MTFVNFCVWHKVKRTSIIPTVAVFSHESVSQSAVVVVVYPPGVHLHPEDLRSASLLYWTTAWQTGLLRFWTKKNKILILCPLCCQQSDSPIRVAREQWGTVGENLIMMRYSSSPSSWTSTHFSVTTSSSSRVLGFSGSRIDRITSDTGRETRFVSVY